jgi:hypothetical protein
MQPHCHRFLTQEQLADPEPMYPLDVYFCMDCALVQLGSTVPRAMMFLEQPSVSGTTVTIRRFLGQLAIEIVSRFHLGLDSLVVDIGSNDGTWLSAFNTLGLRTLGIEPAERIAHIARQNGIETVTACFGREVAGQVVKTTGQAAVITAGGVFFHIDDLHDCMEGVRQLMANDGVFVVQAMYLLDIIETTAFDNFYHEHLCYYSLKPLMKLFAKFDMEIVDVERSQIYGGSLIVYAQKRGVSIPSKSFEPLLALEEARRLYTFDTFCRFAENVVSIRNRLLALLKGFKADGMRLAAYGASARGNTLLNYCQIGPDILEYAAEKNPLKFGLYTPGMHIPIRSEAIAQRHPPDYYLLLAWNCLDEFLAKEQPFRTQGGKFILPIPELCIL